MEILHKHAKRAEIISIFMKKLLECTNSADKKQLYEQYKDDIEDVESLDIFYLDMYKKDTRHTIEEIKESAGKFVNIFHYPLEQKQAEYTSALFINLLAENKAIEEHLNTLKPYFKKDTILQHKKDLIKGLERCLEFEKKFIKKENIIFPRIESKVPSTKPLEVLWSLHDDARQQLGLLLTELNKENPSLDEIIILIGSYYYSIFGLHQKEELILLPVANKLLSETEKTSMYQESLTYGYVFLEQPEPSEEFIKKVAIQGSYKSDTGTLSFEQLTAIFKYLPVDITFVDKDDRVTYFNDRKQRHFPRNPSIIGRLVKYCHPPKSVHVVENIVNAFKNKEKDFAEFWITFNKTFLYILYYAIRSEDGDYLGTLEVSQDVTKIRALEGEQRILDWEL